MPFELFRKINGSNGICKTEKDFIELTEYIKEYEFDRLGVFTYSHEDGTTAAEIPDRIPLKEKLSRQKHLLDIQKEIKPK